MPRVTVQGNQKRLKDIRLQLECTQKELAKTLGVKTNTVARWEQGVIPMPLVVEFAAEHVLYVANPVANLSNKDLRKRISFLLSQMPTQGK